MASVIQPGDTVLVGIFGRFGHLKTEIAKRAGAKVVTVETDWGTVFTPDQIEDAVKKHKPRMLTLCQGDTSTTMLQPLDELGKIARKHDAIFFTDCTASLAGNPFETDAWQIDMAACGLQKCLSGPAWHRADHVQRARGRDPQAPQARRSRHQAAGSDRGQRPDHPVELFRPRHDHGLLEPARAQPPHRSGVDALCRARVRARRAGGRPRQRHRAPRARVDGVARRPRGHGPRDLRRSQAPHEQRHRRHHPEADHESPTRCAPRC